jgi:hypothetical protein
MTEAMMKKIEDDVTKAIANYTGPVTRCPTGVAAEQPIRRAPDAATRWLSEHRDDPQVKDPATERRRAREERLRRERICERNATLLRRIGGGA